MATITASVAGGNWSANGAWVGATPPTAAVDVLLTATSGNITIDGSTGTPSLCRSLDCTGYTGTLTHGALKYIAIGDGSGGKLVLVSGMTYNPSGTSVMRFLATNGPYNITTATKTMGFMTFNGSGGSWTLQDALTTASGATLTLQLGTLDTNSKAVTVGIFLTSGSGTKQLTLGTTNIHCIQSNSTVWDALSGATGLTLSIASGTITLDTGAAAQTFAGGGFSYPTVVIDTSSGGQSIVSGANTFVNFTRNGPSSQFGGVTFTANQTITTALNLSGASVQNRQRILASPTGTQVTLTCNGTVTIDNCDLGDIVGAGSASWDVHTNSVGDMGNNSGITFPTPVIAYWVGNGGSWSNVLRWSSTSGGAATTVRRPVPGDTAVFDANSITSAGQTITMNNVQKCAIDLTLVANNPTVTYASTSYYQCGDIVLPPSANLTWSAANAMFAFYRSFSITSAGSSWAGAVQVQGACTCTFVDDFNCSSTFQVSSTAYGPNAQLNCTTLTCSTGATTFKNIVASSTWTLSGGSLTLGAGASSGTTFTNSTNTTNTTLAIGSGLLTFSSTFTLSAGSGNTTINDTGGGITASAFSIGFGSTKTITMTGPWTATGTGTVWSVTTGIVTLIGNATSTIYITDTSASTKTLNFSGTATITSGSYPNVDIAGAASNGTVTINSGSGGIAFNQITIHPDCSIIWTKNLTYTMNNLIASGTSGHGITFATNTAGTAATLLINNQIVNCNYISIKDSHATGTAEYNAGPDSTTNVSGNTGWNFRAGNFPSAWDFEDPVEVIPKKIITGEQFFIYNPVAAVTAFYQDAWQDSMPDFAKSSVRILDRTAHYEVINIQAFNTKLDQWEGDLPDTARGPQRGAYYDTSKSVSYTDDEAIRLSLYEWSPMLQDYVWVKKRASDFTAHFQTIDIQNFTVNADTWMHMYPDRVPYVALKCTDLREQYSHVINIQAFSTTLDQWGPRYPDKVYANNRGTYYDTETSLAYAPDEAIREAFYDWHPSIVDRVWVALRAPDYVPFTEVIAIQHFAVNMDQWSGFRPDLLVYKKWNFDVTQDQILVDVAPVLEFNDYYSDAWGFVSPPIYQFKTVTLSPRQDTNLIYTPDEAIRGYVYGWMPCSVDIVPTRQQRIISEYPYFFIEPKIYTVELVIDPSTFLHGLYSAVIYITGLYESVQLISGVYDSDITLDGLLTQHKEQISVI